MQPNVPSTIQLPPDPEDQSYNYQSGRRPDLRDPKFSRIREHLSTVLILITAPLLAVFITAYIFRTYQVDGPSMETTLQDNDRLIINKIPKTISKVTNNDYIPERYDIVVFTHTGQFNGSVQSSEKQLIKRVLGLPGDRVVVKDGIVKVYNSENPNGFLVDQFGPEAAVVDSTVGDVDETVKDGEVFVMGDNRGNSLDSRNLGSVRSEDLIGVLTFRIYPFDKWGTF